MKAFFTRHKKWLLPVGVLTIAYGIASIIRNTGPEQEVITPELQSMVVRSVIITRELGKGMERLHT